MLRIYDSQGQEVVNPTIEGTLQDYGWLKDNVNYLIHSRQEELLARVRDSHVKLKRVFEEKDDIVKVLWNEDEIATRVKQLAVSIGKDYDLNRLVLVAVADGAIPFAKALIDALPTIGALEVIKVKSYEGTAPSGPPEIIVDVNMDLRSRSVLLIDDVLDTGNTLSFVHNHLRKKGVFMLETAVLVNKPKGRTVHGISPRFQGFQCPDNHFIVGYGMDYNGKYRSLPFIGVLDQRVYLTP